MPYSRVHTPVSRFPFLYVYGHSELRFTLITSKQRHIQGTKGSYISMFLNNVILLQESTLSDTAKAPRHSAASYDHQV